jgi:putative proteasome-type protease
MKSNISLGPPIDLVMYRANSFKVDRKLHLQSGAPYLNKIQKLWGGIFTSSF